jgi:nanoRNase/pAp phosphatase (c-di-AMP/oligoRNAs hydrolase)
MNLKQQLDELKNILTQAQSVLIFLPENPSYDHIAGGLSLYLGITKLGKLATIASSTPAKVKEADLVGIDKIKNSLDGKNLVVSFPYQEGMIENVSYNLDNNKFNLVIEPKETPINFSQKEVEFNSGGTQADLVFTIGVKSPANIGHLYENNKDLFNTAQVANIDNVQDNSQHGRINIVNPQLPTISEIIVLVLKNLNVVLDQDIATNLYKGLQKGTNNFHPDKVSALTFEAAALTLRSGAQKKPHQTAASAFSNQPAPIHQPHQTGSQPADNQPQKNLPNTNKQISKTRQSSAPSDLLKPKIFKSNGSSKK